MPNGIVPFTQRQDNEDSRLLSGRGELVSQRSGPQHLVEVEQSDWIAELLAAEPGETWGWNIRHFLIYINGASAYEVAAEESGDLRKRQA